MHRKNVISFSARPLGLVILIITASGILSSIASVILLPDANKTTLYTVTHSINFLGDMITFIGSVMLILNKRLGKRVTQVGSIIFGLAGITFLPQSVIGGIVTLTFAVVFFVLAQNSRID